MKIYLAATSDKRFLPVHEIPYVLESFYYFDEWQIPYLKQWKGFILDSGAFTFMNAVSDVNIDWEAYIDKYAAFINKYDITHFMEVDIDCLVGLKEVERLRAKLERLTGKKSIPVFHKARGKEYFIEMCKQYPYVAIGGIVTKEIKSSEYKYLKWFIDTAHQYRCLIHGLGFTSMKYLALLPFDSVDSTNWKSGGRFGQLHIFKNGIIQSCSFSDKRAKDYKQIDSHNIGQWIKFQKYADKNL